MDVQGVSVYTVPPDVFEHTGTGGGMFEQSASSLYLRTSQTSPLLCEFTTPL